MNTQLSCVHTQELPSEIRYVLVNHRIPRVDSHCWLCDSGLQRGYVRDLRTGRLYCDRYCLAGHARIMARATEYLIRQAS